MAQRPAGRPEASGHGWPPAALPSGGWRGYPRLRQGPGLAGVPQVDDLALDAAGRFFAPVAGDDLAVQDYVGKALLPRPFQGLAQIRGLPGEHLDDLVPVAVRRDPGRSYGRGPARPGRCGRGTSAVPARPARSRSAPCCLSACRGGPARLPAAPPRTASVPPERRAWHDRRSRGVLQQKIDLVVRPLPLRLHAHFRAVRFVRVSTRMQLPGREKARLSEPISLRSSMPASKCQPR
jgi:hypothetical protein